MTEATLTDAEWIGFAIELSRRLEKPLVEVWLVVRALRPEVRHIPWKDVTPEETP